MSIVVIVIVAGALVALGLMSLIVAAWEAQSRHRGPSNLNRSQGE